MPSFQTVFDTPQNYLPTEDYYLQGCTPGLLSFVLDYLQQKAGELTEVYLSIPVYNNPNLHQHLKKLAGEGIKVNIITRPINSIPQNSPRWVTDLIGNKAAFQTARNAYQIARDIFGELYKTSIPGFDLKIFPHLAIRDHQGNPFAQGQQPYSLDLTAFLFLFKQGGSVAFSSSDMRCASPLQEGHLLLAENDWKLLQNTLRFFQELSGHSIPVRDFDFQNHYANFQMPTLEIDQHLPVFFLAPFYRESPGQAEEELVKRIREAKEKIYILSPDINSYEYEVDGHFHSSLEDEVIEHYGFLRPVLERAAAGVEVKFLSKNWPEGDPHFDEFLRIAKVTVHNQFARHRDIASTFLLIDDCLILSSTSFRSDAFVYLDQVRIQGFTDAESEGYSGTFSNTGFFWLVEDAPAVATYQRYFDDLWKAAALQS